MKLFTNSPYAITRNKNKESNSFNDQASSFRKQIFTYKLNETNISKGYFIYSNLLIGYYTNAIDVILVLLLSVFGIAYQCIYCLFLMLNGITYIEAKIQSAALHLIELLRRQFLGTSPKIANQLFFKSLCGWLL